MILEEKGPKDMLFRQDGGNNSPFLFASAFLAGYIGSRVYIAVDWHRLSYHMATYFF
jgi:hypothetical protein